MPQTHLPALPGPPPARGKTCRACGKSMRLVSVEPDTRYTNLDRHDCACDCGWVETFFVLKPDGGH
jgi:hypothetical protein